MHNSGRDVYQRAFADRVRLAIEQHLPGPFEDIVKFGAPLVKMLLCAVDIDRVDPGCHIFIVTTNQQIAKSTRARLPGRFAFMPY
jgi:hypothetical protein